MKNTIIVDIDGVLADYRLGLLYWIRQSYPKLAQRANHHLSVTDTWIDHNTMNISFREWLGVLEMFRMSGGKVSIPLFEGAKMFNDFCVAQGYEIVLVTSRPIDIYSNIYRDTVEWLRINELTYHLLLWSKSKAEMIYKMRLTEKVLFAVDDELNHIKGYSDLGINSFWIDHYDVPTPNIPMKVALPKVIKIKKLVEIPALLDVSNQAKEGTYEFTESDIAGHQSKPKNADGSSVGNS